MSADVLAARADLERDAAAFAASFRAVADALAARPPIHDDEKHARYSARVRAIAAEMQTLTTDLLAEVSLYIDGVT